MKNLVLATVFVASASIVSAQSNITKGDWLAGGTAGFNHTKYGDSKTTEVGFSPNVGYFFINNFAGGLRATVSSTKEKFGSEETTESAYHVGPFVRYYFLPATQKVNIFADASGSFGQMKYDDGTTDSKTKFSQFGIMAGPAIFLTPSTALEVAVGYTSQKVKDAHDASNTIGLNVGFQVHLGGVKKK